MLRADFERYGLTLPETAVQLLGESDTSRLKKESPGDGRTHSACHWIGLRKNGVYLDGVWFLGHCPRNQTPFSFVVTDFPGSR